MTIRNLLAPLLLAAAMPSTAQDGTFQTRSLTPETALTAARAALESCRKQGFQVAVAVTDRAGVVQVLLRDRFAGPHTVRVAADKAWTAVSFRTPTLALAAETQPGRPSSGLRNLPRFLAVGGGRTIEAGGSILGGIGVSGAPGGEADDGCSAAGIKAIADAIEF
ncbi:MAG: heme-binding protein [Burkholderiales bacterium]